MAKVEEMKRKSRENGKFQLRRVTEEVEFLQKLGTLRKIEIDRLNVVLQELNSLDKHWEERSKV